MVRRLAVVALVAVAFCHDPFKFPACGPGDVCVGPTSTARIAGLVQHANGTPMAATVYFHAAPGGMPCQVGTIPGGSDGGMVVSSPDGVFRTDVLVFGTASTRCVRTTAYAGTPGLSDSAFADGMLAFRSAPDAPDTLHVVITLP